MPRRMAPFKAETEVEPEMMEYEVRRGAAIHAQRWAGGEMMWGVASEAGGGGDGDFTDAAAAVAEEHGSLVEQDALEKVWNWSVDTSSQLWEKLEPLLIQYMPEDKNPFWVLAVYALVFFVVVAGLRSDSKQGGPVKIPDAKVVSKSADVASPMNLPHVKLPDGRRVAYREQGIAQEHAQYTVFVIHGFPSSRLAGIPGIKNSLLEEFGVRLIAYDRPGFGESDVHHRRNLHSFAEDLTKIAEALGVDRKFWIIGYSTGGIYAWAAMKYIPDRLEGVGLFAPAGNLYAPNMTKEERSQIWTPMNFRRKLLYTVARWAPTILPFVCKRMFVGNIDKLLSDYLVTTGKDQIFMQQKMFLKVLSRDIEESIQQGDAASIAHEIAIQVRPWGFHLSDFRVRKRVPPSRLFHWIKSLWKPEEEGWEGFSEPIHIWQGTEDLIVPYAINEFAVRMVPQAVLHKLEGEGHFSYFWFCDKCHRNIFSTLFKETKRVRVPSTEPSKSIDLDSYYQTYEIH